MSSNTINAQGAELNAKEIEIIGGDQVKIANTLHNFNISIPKDDNVLDLTTILDKNRLSLNTNLTLIYQHFKNGGLLTDSSVQAKIVDSISESKIIEQLIPNIKSRGGEASTLPEEVDIVKRIEDIINRARYVPPPEPERSDFEKFMIILIQGILFVLLMIWEGSVWLYTKIVDKINEKK